MSVRSHGIGKKQYDQHFREAYSAEFPCILRSRKGEKFAFCSVCACDINIAHSGKSDIVTHIKSVKHGANTKSKDSNTKINAFFTSPSTDNNEVIRAECLFTSFLIEHNVPISAADHAGALFRKMFPTSDIAKKYGCGRTKTTHILQEMSENATSELVKSLQQGSFSLATDGSNDCNAKLYPIIVTYYEENQQKIISTVLSVPALLGDATGRNIGNLLVSQLEKHKVPIENCVAFCCDNAPVMIGPKNGVSAVLKEAQPNIFVLGCICHLINLAAEKAAARLPAKVDDLLIDVFYYLEKSIKRKERLQKFQNLHNKETNKILKHVCTRWLSLGKCLGRLLDQWDPLLAFFKDEVLADTPTSLPSFTIPKVGPSGMKEHQKKRVHSSISSAPKRFAGSSRVDLPMLKSKCSTATREEKIFMFLSSDLNKSYCTFLHFVISSFEELNSTLQSASPQIHMLLELMMDLLKQLFTRFVKPKIIKSSPLLEVQYHLVQNQREDDELVIGVQTMCLVKKLDDKDRAAFFSSVRGYFCTACDYIRNKFPLKDDVLKHAQVAKVSKIEDAQFSSISFFLERFPSFLCKEKNESAEDAVNQLQKQFIALQVDDSSIITDEDSTDTAKWSQLLNIRGADGLHKYNRIARLMLSILTIPHSNAECERVFSLVKKNRTQFRSSMSNTTLESISILKTRSSSPCYANTFSPELLRKAKKATSSSLKSDKR